MILILFWQHWFLAPYSHEILNVSKLNIKNTISLKLNVAQNQGSFLIILKSYEILSQFQILSIIQTVLCSCASSTWPWMEISCSAVRH